MTTERAYKEPVTHTGPLRRLSPRSEREEKNPQALPPKLLLVFGMPRSGTTWLGKIFDSHPDTDYLHEPDTRFPMLEVPLVLLADGEPAARNRLSSYVDIFASLRSVRVRGKMPLFRKHYRSNVSEALYRAQVLVAKVAAHLVKDVPVVSVGQAPTIIWKSIESMGRLPALMSILPQARAVYLIRHPCGYVSSVMRGEDAGHFGASVSAADDAGVFEQLVHTGFARQRGLTLQDLLNQSRVARLAWRWLLFNEHVLEQSVGHERVSVLRYEDLCNHPARKARELFSFCGLAWNDQTEAFLKASTGGNDAGYYSVFKDPTRAATRWREELAMTDQRAVEKLVRGTRAGSLFNLSG